MRGPLSVTLACLLAASLGGCPTGGDLSSGNAALLGASEGGTAVTSSTSSSPGSAAPGGSLDGAAGASGTEAIGEASPPGSAPPPPAGRTAVNGAVPCESTFTTTGPHGTSHWTNHGPALSVGLALDEHGAPDGAQVVDLLLGPRHGGALDRVGESVTLHTTDASLEKTITLTLAALEASAAGSRQMVSIDYGAQSARGNLMGSGTAEITLTPLPNGKVRYRSTLVYDVAGKMNGVDVRIRQESQCGGDLPLAR